MSFAPTILPLLLLWCYPSLSTQTFRIKSDPKATMLSALRNPAFPKWLSCIARWNCLSLSEISLDSLPSPSVCPELCPPFLKQAADELGTYKSITCICLWVCMYIFLFMHIYIIYMCTHLTSVIAGKGWTSSLNITPVIFKYQVVGCIRGVESNTCSVTENRLFLGLFLLSLAPCM